MWMGGSIEQEIGPALHWRLEARHVDRGDPKPETVRAAPRMQSAPRARHGHAETAAQRTTARLYDEQCGAAASSVCLSYVTRM